MKKKYALILLIFILITLVFARIYRYKIVVTTSETQRYIDRWTGTEWIKIHSDFGTSRTPIKFYFSGKPADINIDDMIKESNRLQKLENIVVTIWYCSVTIVSVLIIFSIISIKVSKYDSP